MTFNTFSTYNPLHRPFSRRLYIAEFDKELIKKSVITKKHGVIYEKKGLGIEAYISIVGPVLRLLGFALKTKNEKGETIYVNKSSFSHYVLRLRASIETASKQTNNGAEIKVHQINLVKVNRLYQQKGIRREQIEAYNATVTSKWNASQPIHKLIHSFINI